MESVTTNGNAELLNFVFQNSEMGMNTTKQLIGIAHDADLMKQLSRQTREYERFNQKAKKMLNEHGFDEQGITRMDKAKTYMAINMQTLADKSASHISEMLILGSNMGIVDAVKNLKKYKDAEPGVKCLMEDLRKMEEDNVHGLLEFV
jgi:ubiquinone biosynthesis protein COQ9